MTTKTAVFAALALGLAGFAADALADTLVINRLEYKDCHVTGIEGNAIVFDFLGRTQKKPIADVDRIVIDNEPAFNAAEALYAQKEWDKAATDYEKAISATTKQWLKNWAKVRLLESAQKGGRFDVVVRSYIEVAEKNPDTAKTFTLNMPKADSAYLPEAIKLAEAARDRVTNPQSQLVLAKLTVDLYTARGDTTGAEQATQKYAELLIKANPDSPEALAAALKVKLAKINADLSAGKYDQVINAIHAEAPRILDPADQVNMLWALAEAERAKAAANSATTADQWKEISIAYMRVVANGHPNDPKVIDALLKTADILATRLNDKPTAQAMLQRMIDEDYKGKEAARDAAALLAKINK